MTRAEFSQVVRILQGGYRVQLTSDELQVWWELLGAGEFRWMLEAAKGFALAEPDEQGRKPPFPIPGQVRARARELRQADFERREREREERVRREARKAFEVGDRERGAQILRELDRLPKGWPEKATGGNT